MGGEQHLCSSRKLLLIICFAFVGCQFAFLGGPRRRWDQWFHYSSLIYDDITITTTTTKPSTGWTGGGKESSYDEVTRGEIEFLHKKITHLENLLLKGPNITGGEFIIGQPIPPNKVKELRTNGQGEQYVSHPQLSLDDVPISKLGKRGTKGKVAICTVLCVPAWFTRREDNEGQDYEKLDYTILGYVTSGAILAEQIRRLQSSYQIDPIVIIPPELQRFRSIMEAFGWIVKVEVNPARREKIHSPEYAATVDNGSCGFEEWTRLVPLGYTKYDRVVILDMDAMLPSGTLDFLFDSPSAAIHSHGYWAVPWPAGLSVIKPNPKYVPEMLDIMYRGLFHKCDKKEGKLRGWNDTGIGCHYGGNGVQGMLPFYFFHILKDTWENDNETPLEVEICHYNQQLQPPTLYNNLCSDTLWPDQVHIFQWTVCRKPFQCRDGTWEPECYPALRLFQETWIAVQRDHLAIPKERIQLQYCPNAFINIDNSDGYMGGMIPKYNENGRIVPTPSYTNETFEDIDIVLWTTASTWITRRPIIVTRQNEATKLHERIVNFHFRFCYDATMTGTNNNHDQQRRPPCPTMEQRIDPNEEQSAGEKLMLDPKTIIYLFRNLSGGSPEGDLIKDKLKSLSYWSKRLQSHIVFNRNRVRITDCEDPHCPKLCSSSSPSSKWDPSDKSCK